MKIGINGFQKLRYFPITLAGMVSGRWGPVEKPNEKGLPAHLESPVGKKTGFDPVPCYNRVDESPAVS